jgi:hypothetical protein
MSLHLDEEFSLRICTHNQWAIECKILTRQNLSNFQTDYATEMAEFGLMRGELGSEAVRWPNRI